MLLAAQYLVPGFPSYWSSEVRIKVQGLTYKIELTSSHEIIFVLGIRIGGLDR